MDLHEIVAELGGQENPRLLVGLDQADDAGVYSITPELAVVQTADFITPIVDNPYQFGQVAAANALSDVYAMGGEPITALNLCCFPDQELPRRTFREILRGGLEKVQEANAAVVGGHTVRDPELKYGLAVTGTIHPRDLKLNRGALVGDQIVLTKPIGTGILTTAYKRKKVEVQDLAPVVESMMTLNRKASEIMVEMGASAATDITGFGLAVHLLEVAQASRVTLEIRFSALPLFEKVRDCSRKGIRTGVTLKNEQATSGMISFAEPVIREEQLIIFDPQTSGGLAIFVPEAKGEALTKRLVDEGVPARIIGFVRSGSPFLSVQP